MIFKELIKPPYKFIVKIIFWFFLVSILSAVFFIVTGYFDAVKPVSFLPDIPEGVFESSHSRPFNLPTETVEKAQMLRF